MKQAVMVKPGDIVFREVPVPSPSKDEVLVRVRRIGVCGSDIHVFDGTHPFVQYPVVQGHEVAGVIEQLGTNVVDFQVGEKVTIQPQVYCGECYQCTHGAYHICDNLKVMGFQTEGAASEFFSVKASTLVKLPAQMAFDHGAMVEPLAVALHAVERAGEIRGKQILVLGAGPIGALTALSAKALGAQRVMATDISNARLEIAKRAGVDVCVNPDRMTLVDEILKEFGKGRSDTIFECVGSNVTIDTAIELARKGTDIILAGVVGERPKVDLAAVQDRELRIIGTLMYQRRHWEQAVELINSGRVDVAPLITDWFDFTNYESAYRRVKQQHTGAMKVMIRVGE